jgi:hypothetical protein
MPVHLRKCLPRFIVEQDAAVAAAVHDAPRYRADVHGLRPGIQPEKAPRATNVIRDTMVAPGHPYCTATPKEPSHQNAAIVGQLSVPAAIDSALPTEVIAANTD